MLSSVYGILQQEKRQKRSSENENVYRYYVAIILGQVREKSPNVLSSEVMILLFGIKIILSVSVNLEKVIASNPVYHEKCVIGFDQEI